jgi:hypothetical protein
MNSNDPGQDPEVNFYEEYNKTFGYMSKKILDQLSNYKRSVSCWLPTTAARIQTRV